MSAFFLHYILKIEYLPRPARDKHRESTPKRVPFLIFLQATARGNAERAQQKLALQEAAARAERERADKLRAEAERAERERRLAMAALARERAEVRIRLLFASLY